MYLFDYGLSKNFRSSKTLEHIRLNTNKCLDGIIGYSSIHDLGGYEQRRRDDIQELRYVMAYFLKGKLPW